MENRGSPGASETDLQTPGTDKGTNELQGARIVNVDPDNLIQGANQGQR